MLESNYQFSLDSILLICYPKTLCAHIETGSIDRQFVEVRSILSLLSHTTQQIIVVFYNLNLQYIMREMEKRIVL